MSRASDRAVERKGGKRGLGERDWEWRKDGGGRGEGRGGEGHD